MARLALLVSETRAGDRQILISIAPSLTVCGEFCGCARKQECNLENDIKHGQSTK